MSKEHKDIPVYTDIIYEGGYEHPIKFNLSTEYERKLVMITGEGGNRHINILIDAMWIDLWVDTHVYDGKYYAFINSITSHSSLGLKSRQSQSYVVDRVIDLMRIISENAGKNDCCTYWYTKDQLNDLFDAIVDSL